MSERKCAALDQNAKRCRAKATHVMQYHGDSELVSFDEDRPSWVRVEVCQRHAFGVGVKRLRPEKP